MESIVRDAIICHMVDSGLLAAEQHRFVPMMQLLVALESWCEIFEKEKYIFDNGGLVDVIYPDFAKAFDTFPHERLAVKL